MLAQAEAKDNFFSSNSRCTDKVASLCKESYKILSCSLHSLRWSQTFGPGEMFSGSPLSRNTMTLLSESVALEYYFYILHKGESSLLFPVCVSVCIYRNVRWFSQVSSCSLSLYLSPCNFWESVLSPFLFHLSDSFLPLLLFHSNNNFIFISRYHDQRTLGRELLDI